MENTEASYIPTLKLDELQYSFTQRNALSKAEKELTALNQIERDLLHENELLTAQLYRIREKCSCDTALKLSSMITKLNLSHNDGMIMISIIILIEI